MSDFEREYTMKKLFVTLIAIMLLGFLGWQIYQKAISGRKGSGLKQRSVPVAVEIVPVEKTSIQDIRNFTGTLHPRAKVIIAPKVAGRLNKLIFNIGDEVEQGLMIARLDDEEFLQQVDQARAELQVAEANIEESRINLETANREFERTVSLRKKKIASEADLDEAKSRFNTQEAKLKVATAQVIQKEAALKMDQVRLSYTRIRVPKNENAGHWVVGERYVDEGAMLAANTAIVSILDIGSVIAVIHVIERDYSKMRVDLEAVITTDAFPDKTFSGKIVRVAPLLKETSREARVEIEIPNGDGFLKPGMFVRLQIEFDQHDNVTVVPVDALVKRNGDVGVFVADPEEKKAHFVPVTTGIINGTRAEITSPALSGYVVSLGHHLLEDGASIILPDEEEKTSGMGSHAKKAPKKGKNSPPGATP